jgi:hypothetical protein
VPSLSKNLLFSSHYGSCNSIFYRLNFHVHVLNNMAPSMSVVQLMRRKKDYKREEDITRLERFKRGF